mgnify:CR=1 FL=1
MVKQRGVCDPKVTPVVNGGPKPVDEARRETPGQRRGHSTTPTHLVRRPPSRTTARVVQRAETARGPPRRDRRKGPLTWCYLVAGAGFEPATFGL